MNFLKNYNNLLKQGLLWYIIITNFVYSFDFKIMVHKYLNNFYLKNNYVKT